jgi:hypothetical protein
MNAVNSDTRSSPKGGDRNAQENPRAPADREHLEEEGRP